MKNYLKILGIIIPLFYFVTGCQTRDNSDESTLKFAQNGILKDVTQEVGLDFVHYNGMSGKLYFVEMMGGGGALFDYDNDGDLDIYLVQGHFLDPAWKGADNHTPMDQLYRNDLIENGNNEPGLHFTCVTQESQIRAYGYGMGVTTGDYNNDGWVDLYVYNWGDNQLWRNNGDGTFTNVTKQTGTNDPRWTTAAAFLDYDLDGWLDLVIVNYVDYTFANDHPCYSAISGGQDYCKPDAYPPTPDRLLHNRGDGTFEEVTFQSHLARAYGPGLGVAIADFNLDGWPDIYVANDGKENQMWINHQGQYFQNQAILAGTAVNSEGLAEASMGVNVADFDGDGDEDLFMTHLTRETNTFYRNQGQAAYGLPLFEDQTRITGLASSSIPYTGFGTVDFDFDNDGWLDLFIANGHVGIIQALAERGDPFPLKQKNQLFRNLGDGHFIQVSSSEDPVFSLMEVSRGVAKGDLDKDGDEDLLLCNNNGPARILQNEVGQNQNWIGFRLIDPEFKRDALGARIALLRSDGVTLWRRVHVDGSYCSAHDPRITIGLGNKGFQKLLVYWPGGPVEEFVDLKINRYHILNKGSGNTIKSP